MIAVAFALPAESSGFVRLLENRSQERRHGSVRFLGQLHGESILVLHIGVGEKVATQRIRRFFDERPHLRLLISAGFAGALGDELRFGDLLLAENFSRPRLLGVARRTLRDFPHQVGKLASTDRVLDSATERQRFAEKCGAMGVDMETHALAKECDRAGVPLLSVRIVTDTSAHRFPAPPHVLFDIETQKTNPVRLAFYLVTHPLAIGRLVVFSRGISSARRSLTHALDLLVRAPLP
jgi:nucleoside phosphorylase